jgi:predicted transcriptional regulator
VNLGPPKLDPAAYYGLPGQVVATLEPHTEADPAALLLHFLVYFGNAAGAGLHLFTDTAQPARLNVVVVGEAAGRKGTANNAIKELMADAAPDWKGRITPGISTAQAVISLVDDDYASDRRLVLLETEFGRLLARMKSFPDLVDILKQAYDGDRLLNRTSDRDRWLTATRAHISVIGHVTPDVLADRLSLTDLASGFGNRFLFLTVARSKSLPRGGRLDPDRYDQLVDQVADALEFVNELAFADLDPISLHLYDYFGMQPQQELHRSDAFLDRWDGLYEELNRRRPGAVGQLLQRGHTHVLRLAVCYALADRSKTVDLPHLEAAEAVWRYCASSAREVFGGLTDNRDVDKVLRELQRADRHELTRTEIVNVFNRAKKNYDAIVRQLLDEGWVTHRREPPPKGSKGRPPDVYTLTPDALEHLEGSSK